MKAFVVLFLAVATVSAFRIEPTLEREGGRTPSKDRLYLGPSPFIVNGSPADISNFQYMLVLIDLSWGGFICGASAISTRWSLTAAHCVEMRTPANQIQLRGGSTNRNTGGFIFQAQSYTLHPQYNDRTLSNDIAAIQVLAGTPIQGTNVAPARLPANCATACCTTCDPHNTVVSGWGRDENGQFPLLLRQLTAPIHSHADCNRLWGNIGSNFFCKSVIDGRDTCNGDSGSPLVRADDRNLQIGIVSFGTSVCGVGGRPSVNVRIEDPQVRNWVRTLTGI